jgi:hypothetical protein
MFMPTGCSKWVSKSSAHRVTKILKQCPYKIRALNSFLLNGKQEAHMAGDFKNQ